MGEYSELKSFWNQAFSTTEAYTIDAKWVTDEVFNDVLHTYIQPNSIVLDYGSGTGWALPEISYTVPISKGIGIDTSEEGVKAANAIAKQSGLKQLEYICGDESILDRYSDYFDSCISINVIDVLPEEITISILKQIHKALKKDGIAILGINPDYPKELLANVGYVFENGYMYKDGILRGIDKSIEEWKKLLSQYFTWIEFKEFTLTENEKKYPRRMFIVKK